MTGPITLADHAGVPLTHGKPKVNGVEIHYAVGGTGKPVFLLHGDPKTMAYRHHVVPLLAGVFASAVSLVFPGGEHAACPLFDVTVASPVGCPDA
jgi:hypothetical protein